MSYVIIGCPKCGRASYEHTTAGCPPTLYYTHPKTRAERDSEIAEAILEFGRQMERRRSEVTTELQRTLEMLRQMQELQAQNSEVLRKGVSLLETALDGRTT